jgi:hypothetical protein
MGERDRFVRGTLLGTLWTVTFGLGAFAFFRMWGWALGLAAGALVSVVSFQLIVGTVGRLTAPRASGRRGTRWLISSLGRLLGVGALLFVAIRYLPVNLLGLALGLLTVQVGMAGHLLVAGLPLADVEQIEMEERNP